MVGQAVDKNNGPVGLSHQVAVVITLTNKKGSIRRKRSVWEWNKVLNGTVLNSSLYTPPVPK